LLPTLRSLWPTPDFLDDFGEGQVLKQTSRSPTESADVSYRQSPSFASEIRPAARSLERQFELEGSSGAVGHDQPFAARPAMSAEEPPAVNWQSTLTG
jgi:hypothetical protein